MKTVYAFVLLCLLLSVAYGQKIIPQNNKRVLPTDSIVPEKGAREEQVKEIKKEKIKQLSDTTGNEPRKAGLVDTTVQNKYGDMLNDDSLYNKRYPVWIPTLQTFCFDVSTSALTGIF